MDYTLTGGVNLQGFWTDFTGRGASTREQGDFIIAVLYALRIYT